jgi:hypothetical protein
MEYEQRVTINFLTNASIDAHEIHMSLSAQFGEQTHALRRIQFWVCEIDRAEKTSMMSIGPEDQRSITSTQRLFPY